MDKGNEAVIQTIGALIGGYAQMASVISQMLEQESLTDEERSRLLAVLGDGVLSTAKTVNDVLPGLGDHILQIWTGHRDS